MKAIEKVFILSLAAILSATGCKKDKPNNNQASLENINWVLSYVQNNSSSIIQNFPETEINKIMISFSGSSKVISFKGICNTGDGTYFCDPEKGELTIMDLGATKIACTDVEWEVYTIQSLNKAYQYDITGDILTIYTHGDYNLYFIQQ